jgi:hypothetical protein
LSFAGDAGEIQTIQVTITGDNIVEDNETFSIILGDVTGTSAAQDAAITSGAAASGLINNDDTATVSISDVTAVETDGDFTTVATVTLDAEVEGGFALAYGSDLGTAEAGDFTVAGNSLSFAGNAGETETIDVTITGDNIVEDHETFTITLGDVSGTSSVQAAAITSGAIADGLIENDDTAKLLISDVMETETDTNVTVQATVTLDTEVEGGLQVGYSWDLGTAEAGDVSVAGSSLNFTGTIGETHTIDVTIVGDQLVEDNETFTITLGDVSGTSSVQADAITSGAVANGLINNDDFFAGRVFDDLNNNGLYDSTGGDIGLAGITMQLLQQVVDTATGLPVDQLIAETVTGPDGRYEFANVNLPAGTYAIEQVVDQLLSDMLLLDGKETAGINGGSVDDSQDSNRISDIDVGGSGAANAAADYLFAEIGASDIYGSVWEDQNNDGQINFGEAGIEGVTLTLSGTDDRNQVVNRSQTTDTNGTYAFIDLRPGTYSIQQTQPDGYTDGQEALGEVTREELTVGAPGTIDGNDKFSGIQLVPGSAGDLYNFGERPVAQEEIVDGSTAGISFWHNKRGQDLINALNGGPSATALGTWLAATFPSMYGEGAFYDAAFGEKQDMNLAGRTNQEIGEIFKYLFKRNKRNSVSGGTLKLDAEVMAVALSTYVTSENLAGDRYAAAYGFVVSANGIAYTTYNVLDVLTADEADQLGLTAAMDDSGNVALIEILAAVNSKATAGLLYDDDGNGTIDTSEELLRTLAHDLFTAINKDSKI